MAKEEKKFCRDCGAALVEERKPLYYNEYTGEPVYPPKPTKYCPNTYCNGKDWGW